MIPYLLPQKPNPCSIFSSSAFFTAKPKTIHTRTKRCKFLHPPFCLQAPWLRDNNFREKAKRPESSAKKKHYNERGRAIIALPLLFLCLLSLSLSFSVQSGALCFVSFVSCIIKLRATSHTSQEPWPRNYESPKKVSKGRPTALLGSCSVVAGPKVQCEVIP